LRLNGTVAIKAPSAHALKGRSTATPQIAEKTDC
jgi:hypothetical protein